MFKSQWITVISILAVLGSSAPASAQSGPKTIEMSVVTDWQTVQQLGSVEATHTFIEETVATTAKIFREQLGVELVLTWADIPSSPEEDRIAAHENAQFLLDNLKNFKVNDQGHRYSDVTTLFTTRKLSLGSRQLVGFAAAKAVCSASSSAIVRVKQDGLEYQTLAHEIGHTLGASHDGDPPCESEQKVGWLMGEALYPSDHFSQCSVDMIKQAMENYGDCFDAPISSPTQPPAVESAPSGGGGACDIAFVLGMLGVVALQARSRKRRTR